MSREAVQPAGVASVPSASGRIDRILALKAEILEQKDSTERRGRVSRFASEVAAFARDAPAQEARDLFAQLLDSDETLAFVDTAGAPGRVAVVNALLSLGFPHALEVSPGDLDLVRLHAVKESRWARRGLQVAAGTSAVWFGLLTYGTILEFKYTFRGHAGWVLVGLAFALWQAITALLASKLGRHERRQKILSAMAWLGVALVTVCGIICGYYDVYTFRPATALMLVAPVIATTVFASLHAKRLKEE